MLVPREHMSSIKGNASNCQQGLLTTDATQVAVAICRSELRHLQM